MSAAVWGAVPPHAKMKKISDLRWHARSTPRNPAIQ